nr:hypothetical protein [Tanacetum cinerariifolium]
MVSRAKVGGQFKSIRPCCRIAASLLPADHLLLWAEPLTPVPGLWLGLALIVQRISSTPTIYRDYQAPIYGTYCIDKENVSATAAGFSQLDCYQLCRKERREGRANKAVGYQSFG